MAAKFGFGSKFQISVASVYTTIAHVTNIAGPGITRETFDASDMESPEGWREHGAGLKDVGDVTIDLNYDPAASTHRALYALLDTAEPNDVRVVFPSGSTLPFKAILTGLNPTTPMADKLTKSVTFKGTGKPTYPT
ncbi:MAG: phage tail tube protein [Planctomycetia bacterium]